MDSLTIAVPKDQQDAVAGWQDDGTYTLTVKQTAPGQFQLMSSAEAEGDSENAAEGGAEEPAGGSLDENPAMAAVMATKKSAK